MFISYEKPKSQIRKEQKRRDSGRLEEGFLQAEGGLGMEGRARGRRQSENDKDTQHTAAPDAARSSL